VKIYRFGVDYRGLKKKMDRLVPFWDRLFHFLEPWDQFLVMSTCRRLLYVGNCRHHAKRRLMNSFSKSERDVIWEIMRRDGALHQYARLSFNYSPPYRILFGCRPFDSNVRYIYAQLGWFVPSNIVSILDTKRHSHLLPILETITLKQGAIHVHEWVIRSQSQVIIII